jgi:hypothetical protein
MENLKPADGADDLTAQTNLAPLAALGQIKSGGSTSTEPIKQ